MLTHPSIVLLLRRHHLFSQLPERVFEDVCSLAVLKRLECNSTLMHQGDPAKRFFLLVSGQIKLFRVTGEGQENLVEIIQPGRPSPKPCCSARPVATRSARRRSRTACW